MAKLRIKNISEIKTVDDLNHLKLKKKYELDLKKLELNASLIRVQMELDPENIKQTIFVEAQIFAQGVAMKYVPSFVLNFFSKRM